MAGHPEDLAATWDVAFESLTVEAPGAVEVLRHLAYVAADDLPVALLDGLVDGDAGELVSVLARYAMVAFSGGQVSVHRLVQDMARGPLGVDQEARYLNRWGEHLRDLGPDPEDHRSFAWYSQVAPHLLALGESAAELDINVVPLAEAAIEAGISLIDQARYLTAVTLLERALTINEAVYGPDHPQVAVTLTILGNAHRELGDNDRAVGLYRRALTIFEAVYGPDHPQVAVTLGNLGGAHRELGDNDQAVGLYQRELTIQQAAYGPDHPRVASTLTNLGNTHRELGHHDQAVELLERALTIKEGVYGPDHPEVAITLTNLGAAHGELGHHDRAVELFERALTIKEAAYGPDHPRVAITLTNLGVAHCELGDNDHAVEVFERALTINEAVYGPDHPYAVKVRRFLESTR